MMPVPVPLSPMTPSPLVEVLDSSRRTLALLPAAEVMRQKLCHRSVTILLFDKQKRLHLRRRHRGVGGKPGPWDVSVRSVVLAGESLQDAAIRALQSELGIHAERVRPLLEIPAAAENNNEFQQVFTLVRTEIPPNPAFDQEIADYYFSQEELACLLRDFRELLAPRFLFLASVANLTEPWKQLT